MWSDNVGLHRNLGNFSTAVSHELHITETLFLCLQSGYWGLKEAISYIVGQSEDFYFQVRFTSIVKC